ncbi:MAG: hypothetical protein JW741_12510 [Sedimentisphaerales bacterium]|nr:hypothetical protein [Sedimentisphaerales bacterium]
MRKLLVFLVLAVGAGAVLVLLPSCKKISPTESAREPTPGVSEPLPETIAFDVHYRGLTAADNKLAYNAFYGYGRSGGDDTSFIQAVREEIGDVTAVYNPAFGPAQWSALEVRDGKPAAFYFDLNADGKLADDEKILPQKGASSNWTDFYTPDFLVHKDDGRLVPFRAVLRVHNYGSLSCMWSPACVLKGTTQIDGQPATLVLFCQGFSGEFTDYGRSSFMLNTGRDQDRSYYRSTLSRLVCIGEEFYRLSAEGRHEKDGAVRVVLEKDATPRGELAVAMAAEKDLEVKLNSGTLVGGEGADIHFRIFKQQTSLPAGTYRLTGAVVDYTWGKGATWRVRLEEGPEVAIEPDQSGTAELGGPELAVVAVDDSKRYHSDVEEKSVYAKGTTVCLSPRIKGQAGEIYTRFSKAPPEGKHVDIAPAVRILDPDGKEIVSEKIDYG